MSRRRKGRLAGPVMLAVPLVVLAVVALVLTWGRGGDRAAADAPHAGLDFSMEVAGVAGCSTAGGDATCTLGEGAPFTVNVNLNSTGVPGYQGFDIFLQFTGVNDKDNADTDPWPPCTFPAAFYGKDFAAFGCALFQQDPSTHTGLIATLGFNCLASGSISMVHHDGVGGTAKTALTEAVGSVHAEGRDTMETLNITCGTGPPPPTATPSGPTDTPGPTATPGPPTATRTPTRTPTPRPPTATPPAKAFGDVNNDGLVNSVDALWVLWLVADLVDQLPNPASADANSDGRINALDAQLILQFEAGLIPRLPV